MIKKTVVIHPHKIEECVFYDAIEEWSKDNPTSKNDLAKINLMSIAKIYNRKIKDQNDKILKEGFPG